MPESAISYPVSRRQALRDASGLRHACSACGNREDSCGPLVISIDGMRIGEVHFRETGSGYYGTPFSREESGNGGERRQA
jgi:hypothetical protein